MSNKVWTNQELEILKTYYPELRCAELLELLPQHSQQAIKRKANRLGIHKQRVSNGYQLNEKIFQTWSIESAYLFGYLSADGCLKNYGNGYFVSITAKKADKKHLETIKEMFQFGGNLSEYHSGHNSTCYALSMGSKKIYQDLINLGLTPNKTRSLQFPITLPVEFYPSYLRGLTDGDGTISYHTRPNAYLLLFRFGSATKSFTTTIRKIICNSLNFPYPAITKRKDIDFWAFSFSGFKAKKYLDWIYEYPLFIKLDRKYQRYILFDSKGQSIVRPADF